MAVDRILTGSRWVETLYGDTLQAVAARELGHASRWVDIANINGLRPPYLTGNTAEVSEGVRLYGQLILVPAAVSSASAETDPALVFKTDVDLTGGLLAIDERGDLATVTGRKNLHQALKNRIDTPLNALLFHRDYGNGAHALKGSVNGPIAQLLAAKYVEGCLLTETRIETVLSVKADSIGDAIPVLATVQPIAGTTLDLSTVV